MPINLNLPKKPGLFVTGIADNVGKTLIAGAITKILTDAGLKVGVFKPVATGCRRSWDGHIDKDTEFLAFFAKTNLPLTTISPVGFLGSGAPLAAAAFEKTVVDFQKIADAYKKICSETDMVIIEGISGIKVPLTAEFDLLDLAEEFKMPVVLVTPHKQQTINHTLMTIDCIRSRNMQIAGVVVNGYKATESTMLEETTELIISKCGDVKVLATVPFDNSVDIEEPNLGEFIIEPLAQCDWRKIAGVRKMNLPEY